MCLLYRVAEKVRDGEPALSKALQQLRQAVALVGAAAGSASLAPALPITGAVGSPVNPLAIK